MNDQERELIHRAQEGSRMAFEQLVQKYDRKIIAVALQLVGNTEDAEDIVQDVFMRVYKNIHHFRFESDFYTWLYRIVVNCAISYRRKRSRHMHRSIEEAAESFVGRTWTPASTGPGPDSQALGKELKEQIDSALDDLSLMQRIVIVLKYFHDFKIREIAVIIGCSEGTVKNYLFRGTQKMKRGLASYTES